MKLTNEDIKIAADFERLKKAYQTDNHAYIISLAESEEIENILDEEENNINDGDLNKYYDDLFDVNINGGV